MQKKLNHDVIIYYRKCIIYPIRGLRNWLRGICKWLTNNKVFFESLAVLLSLVAIVIAFQSYQLVDQQIIVGKSEHQPSFDIIARLIYDPTKNQYTKDYISISNQGTYTPDMKVNFMTFINIQYQDSKGNLQVLSLPMIDYYTVIQPYDNPNLVAKISNDDKEENWLNLSNTIKGFTNDTSTRNGTITFTNIARYVRIEYQDIYGSSHVNYYSVDENGKRDLSNYDGDKLMNDNINVDPHNILIYPYINSETLYNHWLNYTKEHNGYYKFFNYH